MRGRRDAAALLPPVLPGWPSPLRTGDRPAAEADAARSALARIRAERLFWPAPRSGARRARALALDAAGLAAARLRFADADILRPPGGAPDPAGAHLAGVDPETLEAVFGAPSPALLWARIGGLAAPGDAAPDDDGAILRLLAAARGVSPWGGGALSLDEALAAQALLRDAAMKARGPVGLFGMSPWKRRCLRPFLTGPDGPPRTLRDPGAARRHPGPVAVWGASDAGADIDAALRIEDGFLRSVGLGLRHTPPLSLTIDAGAPYFDATRRTAFEDLVAAADFDPALLARAARLRARIVALGLTKYNLSGATPLPAKDGRLAVLAPGQVENDASIRLGAFAVRGNLALLEATRARFPDALIVYKPHPDVLTGLRPGHVAPSDIARLADHVATDASVQDCLDWADRVATITSLMGFEALLRDKPVTCFGRPFYAGWGLTDDADPPPRDRRLSRDALVAAALILYPRYVDPETRLPAPPEAIVEALARQRARRGRSTDRALRLWRDLASWSLNRLV